MQGNILEEESTLKIRGCELIVSSYDEEFLYLNPDDTTQRYEMQCIMEHCGNFIIAMVSKSEVIFTIDCEEKFSNLAIFSAWPKHTFKISSEDEDKAFKSIAFMRNMLPFERQPVENDNFSKQYCN